eukprot:5762025-Prymnesium_polylepis.2
MAKKAPSPPDGWPPTISAFELSGLLQSGNDRADSPNGSRARILIARYPVTVADLSGLLV